MLLLSGTASAPETNLTNLGASLILLLLVAAQGSIQLCQAKEKPMVPTSYDVIMLMLGRLVSCGFNPASWAALGLESEDADESFD
jgi:hypothetical protein